MACAFTGSVVLIRSLQSVITLVKCPRCLKQGFTNSTLTDCIVPRAQDLDRLAMILVVARQARHLSAPDPTRFDWSCAKAKLVRS